MPSLLHELKIANDCGCRVVIDQANSRAWIEHCGLRHPRTKMVLVEKPMSQYSIRRRWQLAGDKFALVLEKSPAKRRAPKPLAFLEGATDEEIETMRAILKDKASFDAAIQRAKRASEVWRITTHAP